MKEEIKRISLLYESGALVNAYATKEIAEEWERYYKEQHPEKDFSINEVYLIEVKPQGIK